MHVVMDDAMKEGRLSTGKDANNTWRKLAWRWPVREAPKGKLWHGLRAPNLGDISLSDSTVASPAVSQGRKWWEQAGLAA